MVKTILANSKLLSYLQHFDTSVSLSIGLVLGQASEGKDYVVHMAKTSVSTSTLKTITDINSLWLADHGKQATKMLSGGMHVIGIFIVSETDLMTSFPPHLKAVLHQLDKSLSTEYLYGNTEAEKIILNYCSKSKSVKCKLFDAVTSSIKLADVKFSDEVKWIKLECKYDIQKNYYWEEKQSEMDLKEQMNIILEDVSKNLKSSIILFDGEYKSEDETLDSTGKKKKSLKSARSNYENNDQDNKRIAVQILEETGVPKYSDVVFKNTNNQIKVVGQITSTVWMNPSVSYKTASKAIVEDIIRSLSTRLEMHCDSLIEEEHKEDSNSIHEPPRRVMIAIPGSEITVSDYLFPGEGAEEAKNSVEEILDIKLDGLPDEIQEVEGSIDITNYGGNISQIVEGKITKEDKEHSHMLYIIGSVFALIVLLVSIIVHFILKSS